MGGSGTTVGPRLAPSDRRPALLALARSLLVAMGIVVGYFVLPMTHLQGDAVATLGAGLTGVVALLAWEIRGITRSAHPRLRGVEALAVTLALFFACFATTYYLMSDTHAAGFTEPLSRLDSAYFTVTVFSTVGFGDIAAVSQTARAVVTLQMLADLALIGFVARILVNIVRAAVDAKDEQR